MYGGNLIGESIYFEWLVDFILANAVVIYMHWTIKKNLVVFNLADFCNLPNCKNKFYAKFSSYTVVIVKPLPS